VKVKGQARLVHLVSTITGAAGVLCNTAPRNTHITPLRDARVDYCIPPTEYQEGHVPCCDQHVVRVIV
jgi:hypothetical protein